MILFRAKDRENVQWTSHKENVCTKGNWGGLFLN